MIFVDFLLKIAVYWNNLINLISLFECYKNGLTWPSHKMGHIIGIRKCGWTQLFIPSLQNTQEKKVIKKYAND